MRLGSAHRRMRTGLVGHVTYELGRLVGRWTSRRTAVGFVGTCRELGRPFSVPHPLGATVVCLCQVSRRHATYMYVGNQTGNLHSGVTAY